MYQIYNGNRTGSLLIQTLNLLTPLKRNVLIQYYRSTSISDGTYLISAVWVQRLGTAHGNLAEGPTADYL